jgi:hypothetical protein
MLFLKLSLNLRLLLNFNLLIILKVILHLGEYKKDSNPFSGITRFMNANFDIFCYGEKQNK